MILHLETSTKICSVAISRNNTLIDYKDVDTDQFIHGEALTVMIESLLVRNNLEISNLKAISLANGPGSYTGLRIGLSTAKGLAVGLSIPIMALSSLECLIELAKIAHPNRIIAAAFDARRDEVFMRIQRSEEVLLMDQPLVINAHLFSSYEGMIWVGDANLKIRELLNDPNMDYDDVVKPSARGQVALAHDRYVKGMFDEIETLTPNYTKAFYSGATG
jgi:tRNA threonylcarbamoyladenosine biosynthesis protein TsaB